jgi:hypothetical protein
MKIRLAATVILTILFVAPAVFAAAEGKRNKGDKPLREGGIEFIVEHAQDLALTADQKTKLTELESKVKAAREKMKDDPDVKEIGRELYELKESGADEEAMRPVRKKMREAMEKKSGMTMESVGQEIGKILSPVQLKKLAELRKESGMDPNPGKTMRAEKEKDKAAEGDHTMADNSKPAPKLYDDDKK